MIPTEVITATLSAAITHRNRDTVNKLVLAALVVVVWSTSTGCPGNKEEEVQALLQHTVQRYTQLLAEGYANMNMTNLQEVATKDQALKVYNHMSALGEAKIRMESHLEDIEFKDIQLSDKDRAKVMTREQWNYVQKSTDTQMPRQSVVEDLIYDLAYDLVRQDGRWLVSAVSVLGEEKADESATKKGTGFTSPDLEGEGVNALSI